MKIQPLESEKAGIIKQGRPVVLAPQEETPRKVVEAIANERSAPIFEVGSDLLFCAGPHSLKDQTVILWRREDQEKIGCSFSVNAL